MKTMSAVDQIEFMIASRRFDKALNLAIKSLKAAKGDNPPSWQLDKIARMAMQIAVQYKQEPENAQAVVQAIDKNPDIPFFLKEKNKAWKASLAQWKPESLIVIGIPEARDLVRNRKSEVDSMRALTGLLALLSKDLSSDDLGEALLLTGESYEALNEISPMALHENYYESCVRQVPHSRWAKQCYKKLENSIILGYSGSSGTHLPLDVEMELKKLKKETE
jgi:hypothetical protein